MVLGHMEGSRERKTRSARATLRTCRSPQKPPRLLPQDSGEEEQGRKPGRPRQPRTARPAAKDSEAVKHTTARKMRESKGLSDPSSGQSSSGASFAGENPVPLTLRQLTAFQDIFKLLSSNSAGIVDTQSLKVALYHVGIQLTPQEISEALWQADLDGDGAVSFQDFLGLVTDTCLLAQCMGQVRTSLDCDPQGLQSLFLEILFKLMSLGFVGSRTVQEVINFYSKRQRLIPSSRGRSRSQCLRARDSTGLNYFCQAARLGGLSGAELLRSLHRLYKAGPRSPYSQIPILADRTRSRRKTRRQAPSPDRLLPKSYLPSRPKLRPGRCGQGFVHPPCRHMRLAKLAPSPPTLVQRQPFSPSPA